MHGWDGSGAREYRARRSGACGEVELFQEHGLSTLDYQWVSQVGRDQEAPLVSPADATGGDAVRAVAEPVAHANAGSRSG